MEQAPMNLNNHIGVSVSGRYKIIVLSKGIIVQERPWARNLILDQGKNYWAGGVGSFAYLVRACAVGTGTATPAASDTGLQSEAKRTITYYTQSGGCGYSDTGATRKLWRTFDFSIESAGVNYTELGWSYSDSAGANLFSRALITGGTVSLTAGQSLRVVYELSITVAPASTTTENLSISGWPVPPATTTEVTWKIQGYNTFSIIDSNGNSNGGYIEPGWRAQNVGYGWDAVVAFAPAVYSAPATLNGVFSNVSLDGESLHPNYGNGSAAAVYSSYVNGSFARTLPSTGFINASQFASTSILFLGYAPRDSEYYYTDFRSVICCNFTQAQTKDTLYRLKFPGFTITLSS